jgi:vacuolar-type H+-ATPase subunit H
MENSNFNQGGQRYDVIKHIDYLIDMIKDASSVPFSDKCSIERTETVNSLQILKNNLPGAVAQSNDIVSRAQDIISTAREKNKKIIDDANRMYAMKVNDHEITKGAREEAAKIIATAEAQAEELRKNAHLYVKQLLENVNGTLSENMAKIQTNLAEIDAALTDSQ